MESRVNTSKPDKGQVTAGFFLAREVFLAVRHDYAEGIDALLAAGGNPSVRNRENNTPLHIAAADGSLEIINTLLAAGAELEARTIVLDPPLHWAVLDENPEVVDALLDAGADPRARNNSGKRPVDLVDTRSDFADTDAFSRLNGGL